MHVLNSARLARACALVTAMVLGLTLMVAFGSTATAAEGTSSRVVAENPRGELRSRVVGETRNGQRVTGSFVPLRFVKKDGKVKVRGLVQGVVRRDDGSKRTFAAMRTMRVKSINGTPVTNARSARAATSRAATCDVLNLVLGPLDLNILGLQISLNRVVLDIVAVSGAGNLLGNLVCAVAGLLDGGLDGLLGRLTRLLNRLLGNLGLGV